MTLAIILSYAALLLLVAFALLYSHWPRWLKALLVAVVTGFYFYGYDAVHAIWGIPSTDALPERFVMLAAVVEEPTQKTSGALYMWVNPLHEGKAVLQPRVYKLPYSKALHEQVNEGIKKGRDGVSQMGIAEPKVKVGTGTGKGTGFLRPGNDEQEIKIRDLPVPQLPEK